MEQDGAAKKLTGQILLNWLTAAADGHGGISSIVKQSASGLTDTYRITMADTTTFDFPVKNGRGITGVSKISTSGLVDTYRITYNDSTNSTFTITNGAKGDKGDKHTSGFGTRRRSRRQLLTTSVFSLTTGWAYTAAIPQPPQRTGRSISGSRSRAKRAKRVMPQG